MRIGNQASEQFQLDVFGEVLDAAWTGVRAGIRQDDVDAPHRHGRVNDMVLAIMDHLDKGTLDLEWDKARVSIPIKVNTEEQALANITKGIDGAWRTYANAARYLGETKKDYDTGLKYIDQSLSLKEDWFNLWIKATLLAGKGKTKDAIALGDKVYDLGKKADFFFLEPEVKKTLAEWKKKG